MIRNIFGMTTADVRKQQDEQLQRLSEEISRTQGTNPLVASVGTGIGAGLARGLMGRLGVEDPAMEEASLNEQRMEKLKQQLSQTDMSNPQDVAELANVYDGFNDLQTAASLIDLSQKLTPKAEEVSDVKTMYDNAGNPVNLVDVNGTQYAMVDGQRVRVDLYEGNLLDKPPKKAEADLPTMGSSQQRDFVSSYLSTAGYDIGDEDELSAISYNVANDLQERREEYKRLFDAGKTTEPWIGDDVAVQGILNQYQRDKKLTPKQSFFGAPTWSYSLNATQEQEQQTTTKPLVPQQLEEQEEVKPTIGSSASRRKSSREQAAERKRIAEEKRQAAIAERRAKGNLRGRNRSQ